MNNLLAAFRYKLKYSRLFRWSMIVVLVLVALYAYGYYKTFSPEYQSVPTSAWSGEGGVRQTVGGIKRHTEQYDALSSKAQGRMVERSAGVVVEGELRGATPHLQRSAGKWVQVINENNMEAILYHEVDNFGILYVAFGGWWGTLERHNQAKALRNLAQGWRQYLYDSYGQWDISEGLEPGIVVIDVEGEVARDMDGETAILRDYNYGIE